MSEQLFVIRVGEEYSQPFTKAKCDEFVSEHKLEGMIYHCFLTPICETKVTTHIPWETSKVQIETDSSEKSSDSSASAKSKDSAMRKQLNGVKKPAKRGRTGS
jgi:hypothetical protein